MAASVDPLVVGRVIGDVLDMYIPTANMSVYVGPKHITNGCEIKPSAAVKPPKVNISGNPDELYTLVYLFILSLIYIYVQSPLQTYLWIYARMRYMFPLPHVKYDHDYTSPQEHAYIL